MSNGIFDSDGNIGVGILKMDCDAGGSGSALPPGKRRLQDSGSDSDDEDRAASSGSQPSAGELHAETQRVLRGGLSRAIAQALVALPHCHALCCT